MRTPTLSLLLMLSAAAFAADYKLSDNLPVMSMGVEKVTNQGDNVDLVGKTSTALVYSAGSSDHQVIPDFLEGDVDATFRLSVGDRMVVTKGTASALGVEPKKRKLGRFESVEVVTLPPFQIGDAIFTDVVAVVGSSDTFALGAFPNLAWAVMPSSGEFVIAPATVGAELVSAVGGTTLPYTNRGVVEFKEGSTRGHSSGNSFRVQGSLNGQDATLLFRPTFGTTVKATRDLLGDSTPVATLGLSAAHVATLDVGGMTMDVPVMETAVYRPSSNQATVHIDAGGYDMAVDPASNTLAIKPADTVKHTSTFDADEAELLAALSDADGNPLEGDAAAGTWSGLSSLYRSNGHADKALEYATKVAGVSPDKCSTHESLGKAQLLAGAPADAAASFAAGAELYEPWAELSLEQRDELAEAAGEGEETELAVQDHGCADLRGWQAYALLAQGELDQVTDLYDAHYDLDPWIAEVAAVAYLAQERYDRADAATRQVQLREQTVSGQSALLYAVTQHARGQAPNALQNYGVAAAMTEGPLVSRAMALALVEVQGDAGVARMKSLAPLSADAAFGYAAALDATGQDATSAYAAAAEAYTKALRFEPADGTLNAGLGFAQLGQGDVDAAKASGEAAIADAPQDGAGYILLGDVAAANADWDGAAEWYAKAASMDPTNPLLAGLHE
jgi:hypothetical protein